MKVSVMAEEASEALEVDSLTFSKHGREFLIENLGLRPSHVAKRQVFQQK